MGNGQHNKKQHPVKTIVAVLLAISGTLVTLGAGLFQTREAHVLVHPAELAPGSPMTVILAIPASPLREGTGPEPTLQAGALLPLRAVILSSQGKPLQAAPFFHFDRLKVDETSYMVALALLAIPNTYEENKLYLEVQRDEVQKDNSAIAPVSSYSFQLPQRQILSVASRSFNTEIIALGPENTEIKTKPDPQKKKESLELWELVTSTTPKLYTEGPFAAPVDSNRRTSFFGDRRLYHYSNGSSEGTIHGGIDFGVPRGTPVRATAPGLVRMARFRIVTGYTVILDHAPGVYSLYYHLDSLSVGEGNLVDRGTELGKSGSTGLSTGPHLHWEFRIQGEFADPDLMMTAAPLDRAQILGRITETLRLADN